MYNGSRFIHLTRTDSNLFFFMAEYYSSVCMCVCVCIMTKPSTNNIAKQFFNLKKKKVMEGIYMYPCLIHVDVWKETNTYYKAIILQLKIKIKKPYYPRSIETKIWGLLVT